METKVLELNEAWLLMENFNTEVFKQVFPHSIFLNSFHAGRIEGKFSYNDLFKNTSYEVSLNQSFIHFTTLQSLTSILNNGYFRFSEFNNFEDKSELHYASKAFSQNSVLFGNSQKLDENKECCFAFSACLASEQTSKNTYMWANYANKGNGVCIQFKLNYEKTCHFLLGKMQYGEQELSPIFKLNELAKKFYDNNNGFSYNQFPERVLELLAYHKFEKYREENEVRMFFREDKPRYEVHDHEAIYRDISSNNEVRYFFRTFLKERKSVLEKEALEVLNDSEKTKITINEYFQHYPTFEIEKITLGSSLSDEQKFSIVQLLNTLKNKYNYKYDVCHLNNENIISPYT
jgi:hypothetical protein